MNRRDFLEQASFLMAGSRLRLGMAEPRSSYADQLPDMLLSYLARKLNDEAARWNEQRAKINTPEDLEARNRFVREKFMEMTGGFPGRTPLNPITVNAFERDGYRVENVMFQSRPNFWVTGNLYLPGSAGGPFPGIISPCGHYPLARMQPDYQLAYINLVKSGFVVLAYDPIGQGERRQYWNPRTNETVVGGAIYEHSMAGQLLLLLGEDLTHYRIWDGVRSLDYLVSRPEVDQKRIGCAGHSGGGTLTLFISALDQRVKCAVVNQGGTGHRWPVRIRPESRVGPSDVEQNLFPAAIHGIDLCDLHQAIAPRPLLALIEDYSPRFNEAAEHIRATYKVFGLAERFATEEATDPHAWTVKLRVATTDWFCRWFYQRTGPAREPDFDVEPPEQLYCTPNGSLRYSQQGETIFSVILQKQSKLPPERKLPNSSTELETFRQEISAEIRGLLRFKKFDGELRARPIVTTVRKGYRIEKLEFLSEPGIYVPTWVFVPEDAGAGLPAILFISETGKQAEGMEFGVFEKLVRKGNLIVAVDVRGIGDTKPQQSPSITEPYEFRHLFDVETAMSYMAWSLHECLFGMRVHDVLRSLDYVVSRPDVDKGRVRVIGRGMGALWALYAAALDRRVRFTICENGLLSYRSLTSADRYFHGANIFVRDVLRHFDLPHLAAAVADRHLVLLSPVDAMKQSVDILLARKAYRWTEQTYRNVGTSDRFHILDRRSDLGRADQYLTLLNGSIQEN